MANLNMAPSNLGNSSFNPSSIVGNRQGRVSGPSVRSQLVGHVLAKDLSTHNFGLQKDLETHVGKIERGLERERGKNSVNLARTESEGRLAEQAAAHRHEVRMGVQTHNQELEKAALKHHHETAMVGTIVRHAGAGTNIELGSGDFKAKFTKRTPSRTKAPTQESAPAAPSEPAKKSGPSVTRDPKSGRIVSLKQKA